jgi:hypothetical protein
MTLPPWRARAAVVLLVPGTLWLATGCSRPASVSTSKGTERTTTNTDPLGDALEHLRRATDVSGCREALRLADRHLESDAEGRKHIQTAVDRLLPLRDRLGLETDEVEEVTAPSFRPLDAHHVELCLRLREVAEQMRLHTLPRRRQAEQAFAWVVRQVLLRSGSDDDLLPPSAVLHRGDGSAYERALLFLAFLHQLGLDGCMIAYAGADGAAHYWLAGAVVTEWSMADIYLFDPRLGMPLPGPDGKGVATLRQLNQQPSLLDVLRSDKERDYDVTAAQAKAAQACLAAPLSALAPRLAYLEQVLETRDRVRLALDPAKQLKALEAASGGEVGVWNRRAAPGRLPPSTPTRALRQLLGTDEGGVDPGGRRQRDILQRLWPGAVVGLNYRNLVALSDLPPDVPERLQALATRLFVGYVLVPHERLTRGVLDGVTGKLARLERVTEEFRQEAPSREVLRQQLGEWHWRVKEAYLAAARHGPAGQKQVEQLWSEDQYLLYLTDLSEENNELPKKLERGTLSFLVLEATGELLTDEALYLLGLCRHDMAVRLEIALARSSATADQRQRLAKAWDNAEFWWRKYAERYALTAEAVRERLHPVVSQWHGGGGQLDAALGVWELLFRDFRRALTARLRQAEAKLKAGRKEEAREILRQLATEADALRQNKDVRAGLRGCLAKVPAFPANQQEVVRFRLGQLARELEPDGTLAWLAASARARLTLLGKEG